MSTEQQQTGHGVFVSFEEDELPAEHLDNMADILGRLDVATDPSKMDIPGFHLRALDGDHEGHWSVKVSDDLLISFRFDGSDATDVNLLARQ